MNAPERLYNLLPAVYRTRDVAEGEPLRALMAVLESEMRAIVADLETTYDNWFVETAEEWVLPYIGDLLGVHALHTVDGVFGFSQRGYIANTLGYRRRKGTAAVVEQLALDLTGFRAKAVEYFRVTATTVNTRHVREEGAIPAFGGTVDLRDPRPLEDIDTAFDRHAHLADVRDIDGGRGRHNLPNLGVHLWPIQSYSVTRGTARRFPGEARWFRFEPHGTDQPLFNVPETESDIASLAGETNVPRGLSRLSLYDASTPTDPADPASRRLFDVPRPPFAVRLSDAASPLAVEICHLGDTPTGLPNHEPPEGAVSVDPELGRLKLAADLVPDTGDPPEVLVDYAYGSPGDVGAGSFDRTASHDIQVDAEAITWTRYVTRNPTIAGEVATVTTLEEAVVAWNAQAAAGSVGRIVILGGRTRPDLPDVVAESRTYAAPTTAVQIPEGARLHVVAANIDVDPAGEAADVVVPNRVRATVVGDWTVIGGRSPEGQLRPGGLLLNGLAIAGTIGVAPGDLELLDLAHCDVLPATGGVDVGAADGDTNAALTVRLYRSRCGPVTAAADVTAVRLESSVVQGALDVSGAAVALAGSTLLGDLRARTLEASSSILDGTVHVEQHQQGCLRFSYTRTVQRGPRRYRCQPDLALTGVTDDRERSRIVAAVRPRFVAATLPHPGYALLSPATPGEIRAGGEDGSEMGAFHHLQFSKREANLRHALRQYLRFGLDAGLIIES